MDYREWDGPAETTFVMVHGLGGAHINWVQVAPGLAGLGRVLALDLPGFGLVAARGAGLGADGPRAEPCRGSSPSWAAGDAVLCGNSMGGGIAMLQAAVEPGSVRGARADGLGLPVGAGSVTPSR